MSQAATTTPGGWTCTYCHVFVPWGQMHSCTPGPLTTESDRLDRLAAAAERIAASLERLIEWLAT